MWKGPDRPRELYDLVADPRESRNLAGRAEAVAVEADLVRRLRSWLRKTGDPALAWGHLQAGEKTTLPTE